MDNSVLYCIWLVRHLGENNPRAFSLIQYFGNAENVYKATHDELLNCEILPKSELLRLTDKSLDCANETVKTCIDKGFNILTVEMPEYPQLLKNIYAPPCVLYVMGELYDTVNTLSIAIVGTRKFTDYGKNCAYNITCDLVHSGIIIVSGLATGIDTVANYSAVISGGKTIAVLGSGLDVPYPANIKPLMQKISQNGAVITEYPPGSEPLSAHFPARNRIISGLSAGVAVIEAPVKSGALITANIALEQGRDIFAVPGSINLPTFAGSNNLIKEGAAKLVTCAMDIIEEYTGLYSIVPTKHLKSDISSVAPLELLKISQMNNSYGMRKNMRTATKSSAVKKTENASKPLSIDKISEEYREIYPLITHEGVHIDDLSAKSNIPVWKLCTLLSSMELDGLIVQLPGKKFILK